MLQWEGVFFMISTKNDDGVSRDSIQKRAAVDFGNVVVDREHMCISRDTQLGQEFDAFNKMLGSETDASKKTFMSQLAAYAEAALIVDAMYPESESRKKIDKLAKKMLA